MNWFAFSLLSIGALAVAELTQQHLLNKENGIDERTSTVLTFLVQAVFTLPIILLTDLKYSVFTVFSPDLLPYIIFVTVIATFGIGYYLKSFKVENISISAIFVSFSVVISTTLGIIFLNETAYLYKFIGIALVLLAIISLNAKNITIEKNHYYGLIAGVLFGITYTFDKIIVTDINPVIYVFWAFSLVSLFGFLLYRKTVITTLKKTKFKNYYPIIISGTGYFLYNLFTFNAYVAGGEVGRVDAINNSQIFLIILVEYFVFKHKQSIGRKLMAAGIAFTGVFILGFF